jgi:hypothetical protein
MEMEPKKLVEMVDTGTTPKYDGTGYHPDGLESLQIKRNAILNDKDGNNLINFGEFEVLFRTLGKKRINMAELVDQIENKLNEIMLKRGITPVNRPASGQKVLNDFLQTDNQLLLSNAPHGYGPS